jgi:hypothetical protein
MELGNELTTSKNVNSDESSLLYVKPVHCEIVSICK